MTKLQQTIFITAKDIKLENTKIIVENGEFYFQGKKYKIANGEITKEE